MKCKVTDLAGKEWEVPHLFVHGYCKRCMAIEPKVKKIAQEKYSGRSKSENRYNDYK